jgi:hypothetical protein
VIVVSLHEHDVARTHLDIVIADAGDAVALDDVLGLLGVRMTVDISALSVPSAANESTRTFIGWSRTTWRGLVI